MKKIIKICLLIFSIFLVNNVYAANCDDPDNLEVNCIYPHEGFAHYDNRVSLRDNYYSSATKYGSDIVNKFVDGSGKNYLKPAEDYYYILNRFFYINPVHRINVNGTYVPIFCMDPNGLAPHSGEGDNTLKVKRLLYGEDNKYAKAEDYAMAMILASSNYTNKYDKNFSWIEYNAVSLALRAFRNGVLRDVLPVTFSHDVGRGSDSQRVVFRYVNTINHWVKEDAEFAKLYNKAYENIKASGLYPYSDYTISGFVDYLKTGFKSINVICTNASSEDGGICEDGRMPLYIDSILGSSGNEYDGYWVGAAYATDPDKPGNHNQDRNDVVTLGKKYLMAGLKAYSDALSGNFTTPNVTVKEEKTIKGNHTSTVIVSVNFNNFSGASNSSYFNSSNTSYFYIDSLKTTDSSATAKFLGYNTSMPKDAGEYNTTTEKNIYKLAGGNNKVYLVFKVDSNISNETEEKCNIKFILNYKYDDPKLYSGAQLRIGNLMGGDQESLFQRFITFSTGSSSSISVSLKQCETTCKPQNTMDKCSDSSKVVNGKVISEFKEGYDESNKLNVSKCIIDNSDIKGNSYAVAEYVDNPYCDVYCKEDVTIKSPYKLETFAGRKINLDVEITGVQTCYTTEIKKSQYEADYKKASATDKTQIKAQYDKCVNLNIDYQLEPKITYTYQEKVGNTGTMRVASINSVSNSLSYYTDTTYTKKSTNKYYAKNEKSMTVTYSTPRIYYISHTQLGLIVVENSINDSNRPFYDLVDGLPIDISTAPDTYKYNLVFENIGTYYNTGKVGRIYGNDQTSLSRYTEENNNTSNKYACTYTVDDTDYCIDDQGDVKTVLDCDPEDADDWNKCKLKICGEPTEKSKCIKNKGTFYSCKSDRYVNDPNICKKYGSTEKARESAIANSDINFNCCPNCKVRVIPTCPACIVTPGGGLNVDYRTISSTNINPNNRPMGYNWNYDENNLKNGIQVKAYYTTTEVENSEAKKFEESKNGNELSDNYSLRVEMTPDMASSIRDYNKANKSNGSYTNDTIYCEDYIDTTVNSEEACVNKKYTWNGNNCVIKGILCYSKFIDDLIKDNPEKVQAPNRKSKDWYTAPSIDGIKDQKNIQTNGYWYIFPDYVLENVGPAWK